MQALVRDITYLGVISSSEVSALQESVDFLVNPRFASSDYVTYSFPSKMIEYSKIGKPIIGYKLSPYPRELVDAMLIPKDESSGALVQCLLEATQLDEERRNELSRNARLFFEKYTGQAYFSAEISQLITDTFK
ncbi:hypothetical protein [Pseudidiomarina tainanensis]|uniref:hypothetical protein n=1 Tax=Pseudidiomarina tainanensis TaxID=502365 RepID=UPI0015EFE248|nr:hypothetical protein [Pseudidiomarina tainanensis]